MDEACKQVMTLEDLKKTKEYQLRREALFGKEKPKETPLSQLPEVIKAFLARLSFKK